MITVLKLIRLAYRQLDILVCRVTMLFFLSMFLFPSVFSEEYPPIREEDALAKWASDPANTAWMESKE